MAKKDEKKEINFAPGSYEDVQKDVQKLAVEEDEPLFESEAYGTPQSDEAVNTTVLKTVGIGGPVPIIAPKYNTIQLQPIIVPLAIVPYMTQDSDVLRTDGRAEGGRNEAVRNAGGNQRAKDFSDMTPMDTIQAKEGKKKDARPRVFAAILFLLSGLLVACFLLAKFKPELGGKLFFYDMNVIDMVTKLINKEVLSLPIAILYIIAAGGAAITVLTSLVSLIVGKYPKMLLAITTFLTAAPLVAVLIYEVVKKEFVLDFEIALIIMAAVGALMLLLGLIFAIILKKDKVQYGSDFDGSDSLI